MFITRGNLPKFKILLFNVGRRGGGGRGIKGGRGVNMGKGMRRPFPTVEGEV